MNNDNPHISAPFDLTEIRYCETHEAHWIPWNGATEKGASCPWCQRDVFWDELEAIHDVFGAAVRSKEGKGGQHVPYFGDFCSVPPSTVSQMKWWMNRWAEILGKNVRRGTGR